MGDEKPSTRSPLPLPSGAWEVFKDALVSGQIGAIIGTLALVIIAGQYLGFIESPMIVAHRGIQESTSLNTNLLVTNQTDIRRIDQDFTKLTAAFTELSDAMWAVCFIQATTPETKTLCKDGMLAHRNYP